jgi:DAK2 domain fusion protein YloV
VPDGDTGTNMLLTLQSVVEDIRGSEATEVSKIARIAGHGSLMGARGNSGVILSQIFRGFANAVQGKAELSPQDLANAFEQAANQAYRAVMKPTEGTILTVAREAGRAAMAAAQEPGASVSGVMRAAAAGAKAAVERTPSQLKILHDAGVVDAGGYGLQIMLEGMLRSVEEVEVELGRSAPAGPAAQAAIELPEEGWGYCTEFLVHGQGLDEERIRAEIAELGNSVLAVGGPDLVRVHVHTDDPSSVISLARGYGRVDRLRVGDMSSQHQRMRAEAPAEEERKAAPASRRRPAREAKRGEEAGGRRGRPPQAEARPQAELAPREANGTEPRANGVGIVAVVAGSGLVDIFRSLGVDAIVEGGQTMNPSTQNLLEAVERVPYQEVVLLPNNKNVVLAANEVDALTQKHVRVVETRTVPQGVAAVVAFSPERDVAANLDAMRDAARRVQTIEVTHATRDSRSNGMRVRKGDVIALINDELQHAGQDYRTVVQQALQGIGADGYELVTIYRGSQASDRDAEEVTECIQGSFPGLEVEMQIGGQELYPFILSVE